MLHYIRFIEDQVNEKGVIRVPLDESDERNEPHKFYNPRYKPNDPQKTSKPRIRKQTTLALI